MAARLEPIDSDTSAALAEAHCRRGVAWHFKGNVDKAIADYNEAIRLDPRISEAYTCRGNACLSKQANDKALRDCSKAIQLDPRDADAYIFRGVAWTT